MTAGGEERARRLALGVDAVVDRVRGLSPELLYRDPAEGEWSVMKLVAHIAEFLPYWSRQPQAVASRRRDGEPFGRTQEDPDRIAAVEQHAQDPLDAALRRVGVGLGEAATTLRAIPAEGWARTGRHARRGEMTVAQIVDDFLVSHLEEHRCQVEATLASLVGRS